MAHFMSLTLSLKVVCNRNGYILQIIDSATWTPLTNQSNKTKFSSKTAIHNKKMFFLMLTACIC